jgi:hypothetical protein
MTEQEWLECTDPTPMLEFLRGKGTARKWRLCGVACCRRIWRGFREEDCRNAVKASELYADGSIEKREISLAQFRVSGRRQRHYFIPTVENQTIAAAADLAKLVSRPWTRIVTLRAEMRRVIESAWRFEAAALITRRQDEIVDLHRCHCSILFRAAVCRYSTKGRLCRRRCRWCGACPLLISG